MIKVVAKNRVKVEKIEEFIAVAKQLVKDTRENDAGCVRYELLQDIQDKQIFTFQEEWENKDALNRHMVAKHFKDASVSFSDFMEKPAEVNLYTTLA